ncbi:MAG: hypothetical protein NTX03_15370, partial [Bacteroidetes bacterium]|nr:hypothetical protein [Bacteroidota bacterium]
MIDAIDARVAADTAAKTATQHQSSTIKTEFGELSKNIANDKNLNTYTETIGQAMGIIGSDGHFDPLTYATEITGINTP